MSGAESPAINVIVQQRVRPGLIAGIFGCAFGLLGIFSWGLIFVPLAALCAAIGLFRGIAGRSGVGIGTSILASVLTVWGFIFSPSLWLIFGGTFLAHQIQNAPSPQANPQTTLTRPTEDPGAIAREKTAQDDQRFVAAVNSLVGRMQRFEGNADSILLKLEPLQQRYPAITAKMDAYLDQERKLKSNPNADVARSQISVAINQGAIAADQLHNEIQPTQWDFENNAVAFNKQVVAAKAQCGRAPDTSRDSACAKLTQESSRFEDRFGRLAASLKQIEETYQREHRIQDQIVAEAEQLE